MTKPRTQSWERKFLRLPAIGAAMLVIGSMLSVFGADDFPVRGNHANQNTVASPAAPYSPPDAAPEMVPDSSPGIARSLVPDSSPDIARSLVPDDPPGTMPDVASDSSPDAPPEADPPHEPELVSLGEYKITFYCKCAKCCGKSDGITATGTIATSNRTIAVDPKVIPYGSKVVIDGREYIAEDTGGFKGRTIDMFVDSHQEALSRGVVRTEVYMVQESN